MQLFLICCYEMKRFEELGYDKLPVCMAKTQKSLSDVDSKRGRPTGFKINIREFEVAAGAGFIVPIAGNILRMPGLPATMLTKRALSVPKNRTTLDCSTCKATYSSGVMTWSKMPIRM